MSSQPRPNPLTTVLRWTLGVGLVSWRYLWQTMPMYRTETGGGAECCQPPALPDQLDNPAVQDTDEGVGPLFHRCFHVTVTDSTVSAEQLMAAVIDDFRRFVPSEVVGIRHTRATEGPLDQGDELVVQMPGPWNGPVVVVHRDATCLRLATLDGHLEAGQVQFSATDHDGRLTFEIHAWARPSTRLVHLLYSRMRLAKEIQLNMWVRFCRAVAEETGGHVVDGVHIDTHRVEDSAGRPS